MLVRACVRARMTNGVRCQKWAGEAARATRPVSHLPSERDAGRRSISSLSRVIPPCGRRRRSRRAYEIMGIGRPGERMNENRWDAARSGETRSPGSRGAPVTRASQVRVGSAEGGRAITRQVVSGQWHAPRPHPHHSSHRLRSLINSRAAERRPAGASRPMTPRTTCQRFITPTASRANGIIIARPA